MSSRDPRACAGQAALEYVVVVAVVAAVLLAAGAASGRLADVGQAVVHGVRKGLCVVTGGDCTREDAPCVVSSEGTTDRWGVRIAVVRLGAGWTGLVERRSDGTFVVTRVREDRLGAGLEVGGKAKLRLGREALGLGGEASASVLARLGDGRSWTVGTEGEARSLLRALRGDRVASVSGSGILRSIVDGHSDLPRPEATFDQDGVAVSVSGGGTAGDAGSGSFDLAAGAVWGRRQEADGRRVLYLRRTAALDAAVDLDLLGEHDGAAATDTTIALELDAQGRPRDLMVLDVGELRRGEDLPAVARAAGARLALGEGDRRYVVERHLDLTVGVNLAAAREALRAVQGPGLALRDPAAIGAALRRRLDEAAVVHARTYAVDDAERGGEVGASVGVGLGVEGSHATSQARLLGAATRGLDGVWEARADCLAAV
ncbi:hypothetical protein [Conexibacter sp. SYSU D00693]|uniref:hypothetical protein n=1 Tax=Conexibacter sp. SYSU D00693 TaxID=2812560 RepID=UPI00196B20F0|nr:hypothetical protein [Conexibacter sp. SYSU D00693]